MHPALAVQGGVFGAVLGAGVPAAPLPIETLAKNDALWLGIQVSDDPELPRARLYAVPYALLAGHATTADTVSGAVGGAQLEAASIDDTKISFTYAGSDTKGGAATSALDLKCTGCVSLAEITFDGDIKLGKNALQAEQVTAATFNGETVNSTTVNATTVSATQFAGGAFVGDGSGLTGPTLPKGACPEGQAVVGIDADGTLKCAATLDPNDLPADGLAAISNGLLTNQYTDVFAIDAPVSIKDGDLNGVTSAIEIDDVGAVQDLVVHIEITGTNDVGALTVTLKSPDEKISYVLIAKEGAGNDLSVSFPPAQPNKGDLSIWKGKNPAGTWELTIFDSKGDGQVNDGQLKTWSLTVKTLSAVKVSATKTFLFEGGFRFPVANIAPMGCDAAHFGFAWASPKDRVLRICNGKDWFPIFIDTPGSQDNPAASCKDILAKSSGANSGIYWLDGDGEGGKAPFQVYCDMEIGGGGWTLVAKVPGNNAVMNRKNMAQWRNKKLIGDTTSLSEENALGPAYDSIGFTDVMIRSLKNPTRNLGWRHGIQLVSAWHVVDAGKRIDDGTKLFGSIMNLDYPGQPDAGHHNDCSELKFGFLTGDWSQNNTGIVGHGMPHGHAGGVVGASLFDPGGTKSHNYGPDDGKRTNCVTDFSVGGGYSDAGSGINAHAINAHWWGAGNSFTNSWAAHGIFVR